MERKIHYLAEVSLQYKQSIPFDQMQKISTSRDAELILRRSWDKDLINVKEQFKVLYLNRANRLIAIEEHSTGGLTGTTADVKLIISTALQCLASSIILAHNHPSGNLKFSKLDRRITESIKQAAKLFEIVVLDHLILTTDGYCSMVDDDD